MIPERGIIFDAGTGMFRVRDLIQTDTLDIFLSHVHLDHAIGLTFLYDVLYEKKLSRVTVHVAKEKIAAIRNHLHSQALFPVEPNYDIVPLEPTTDLRQSTSGQSASDQSGTLQVTAIELEHPGGSHGFVLKYPGGSMAYITDTTATKSADYIESIKHVDLLVHECYFPDGWEQKAELTGHSCLTPVAEVAAAAEVGRVMLVHINPLNESENPFDLSSVGSVFAKIEVAKDKMVVPLA